MRRRGRAILIVMLLVFSVFAAQLVRLQGFEAQSIAKKAREYRTRETNLPASRGFITDARGVLLASNVERYEINVDPQNVQGYQVKDDSGSLRTVGADGAARALAPLLDMSVDELTPKLQPKAKEKENSKYEVLKKGVEPLQRRKIEALGIPGIGVKSTQQRSYPGGVAAAPLVGWTGDDGRAHVGNGGGLELVYDDKLTGTAGKEKAERSTDGRVIPGGEGASIDPVPGSSLTLSLDNDLQWYAYNAVAEQVQTSKADWGVAVVMDTQGRLKAAAQYPSFDPNNRAQADNLPLSATPFVNTFEPGSTAKAMSIGAAINEGEVTPTTQFTVENRLRRADRDFRDAREHDTLHLTAAGVLAVSSNIGTIQIAEKVGADKLEDYYRAFGMGRHSATSFPGESAGNMPTTAALSDSQRFTMMFGQGFASTAIQDAGVFQTVANKGVRIPATLVTATTAPGGTRTDIPAPEGNRVLTEESAATLLKMMENVTTSGGTAELAGIPGYRVAGKTGTADRYDDAKKGYSGTTASFIGIAPADNPELICAVIVDNPKGEGHGGDYSAPVFKSVMTYALQKYKIPPTGQTADAYPNYWGPQASRNQTR